MEPDALATPEAVSDSGIVQEVLRGDRNAFAVLVDRHQRRIVAHAYRVLRNRDEALEVAHETFIKAYQNLARYDSAYKFSTWLHAIAGNLAIDHIRARRKGLVSLDAPIDTGDGEMMRDFPGPSRPPLDEVAGMELTEALEDAIAALPPLYRDLILMRHPGGLSYDEIAVACKIPLGTVKARIFRARRRLMVLLGDLLPPDVRDEERGVRAPGATA